MYLCYLYSEHETLKKKYHKSITFTPYEKDLLCRSISDSMNYKPDCDYYEKFNLLLKITKYKLDTENEVKENEKEI